jgi:hypothetical protein
LNEALRMPVGLERRRQLLSLIHESGAIEACRTRLEGVRAEAIDVLRESPLEPGQRRLFIALTELFRTTQRPAPEFAVIPIEAEGVVMPDNGMVDA